MELIELKQGREGESMFVSAYVVCVKVDLEGFIMPLWVV